MGSLAQFQASIFKWSADFRSFYTSGYRCPQCAARLLDKLGNVTLAFYSKSGRRIPIWQGGPWLADSATCPKCSHRFKLKTTAG